MRAYGLYLIRWQLSTPLLAWCVVAFASLGNTWSTVIANLIGGLLFFWVDKLLIFRNTTEVWEVSRGHCKCGNKGRLYRLVKAKGYDRSNAKPIYLCESCSESKYETNRMSHVWGKSSIGDTNRKESSSSYIRSRGTGSDK